MNDSTDRSVQERGPFATRDVSLAAFFKFKGYFLLEYRTVKNNNGRRDGEWVFDMSREEARKLTVEYANSDFAAFEGIRRGMSKQKYS
jgi:hypothetical protein